MFKPQALVKTFRQVLRRLQPKKIRTYLVLLTLMSIFLTQGTVYYAFQYYRTEVLNPSIAELAADTIRILHDAVMRLPESEQADYVQRTTNGKWSIEEIQRPFLTNSQKAVARAEREAKRAWWDRWTRSGSNRRERWQMAHSLNQLLEEKTKVRPAKGDIEALYIALSEEIQEDPKGKMRYERWLKIPLDSFQSSNSSFFMLLWVSAVGISLLLSALFAWYVARPLQKLSLAADHLAGGKPAPVTPHGPYEMRRLAKRFNAMLQSLEEAERTQKTLLGGLPHDLKGPLARMRLRLEMIQEETLKKGLMQDVQDLQKIIEQFIAFLRGKDIVNYYFTTVVAHDWVEERMATWCALYPDIHYTWKGTDATAVWAIDILAVSRLLDNLIQNALQHGVLPIEVMLEEQANVFKLSVTDQGHGFPSEQKEQAFRPFERLDAARTKTGSSGLGLSVVQVIAEAHEAQIECQVHTPIGWTIAVIFPKKRSEAV